MFTLQTSIKPLLPGGGGGGLNPLFEVTVNSKEENSYDFCPNYVQEFSLSTLMSLFLRTREKIYLVVRATRHVNKEKK
jgi:hypothetical protein